jgi:uncharacterized membrane protein YgaE (UPF0421/DUF939 family)
VAAQRHPGPALAAAARGARHRLASAGWNIVETPMAAGLAWFVAHNLLGDPQPFFAPMAAVLSLSAVKVLRGQRALQVLAGVTLGIGIGMAVRAVAGSAAGGSGAVAIGAATLIALVASLALSAGFLGEGSLLVNQSAGSAILMIAIAGAATGPERLLDALVGGGITLVIAVVLFPAAPLPLIRDAARQALATLRDTVAHLETLAGGADPEWILDAGQRIHRQLAGLQQAQRAAREITGLSPRRWPDRAQVLRATEQTALLPVLAASVLSMVHARAGPQPLAPGLRQALHELASAFSVLAGGGAAEDAAVHAARARHLAASASRAGGPGSPLLAGLIETCAGDALSLTGAEDPTPGSTFG